MKSSAAAQQNTNAPLTPPTSDSDFSSSSSSSDNDMDHNSGYSSDSSDACSTLTSGSSASEGSDTSIATPPTTRGPLRGILRTSKASDSTEVSLFSSASANSGIHPSPMAFSYVALAPHATQPIEAGEETSSCTALAVTTRKTRFSDEASFCLAFDYYEYESADESEVEEAEYRSLKRTSSSSRREGGERLAVSKYVTYGSD
ncbi:hypothetical protein DFH27DRAFT_531597 [Peziza echinospora]|nr:hypothetical protein DFH27DRAFT_531597 [Peziza echinospora]